MLLTRTINSGEDAKDIKEGMVILCTTSCVRSEYTTKRDSVSLELSTKLQSNRLRSRV